MPGAAREGPVTHMPRIRPTTLLLPVIVAAALVTGAAAAVTHNGTRDATLTTADVTPGASIDAARLDGATVTSPLTVTITDAGAASVKWVMDGVYAGESKSPPLAWTFTLKPGAHTLKWRPVIGGVEQRRDATFTVTAAAPTVPPFTPLPTLTPAPPTSAPTPTVLPPTQTPTPAPGGAPATITVTTSTELAAALRGAKPGDVIAVADGTYSTRPQFEAPASGTEDQPITLRGTRRAVLTGSSYGLHVTGSHWIIEGLTVANSSKGIVLDGSVGTTIDDVEVYGIEDEGVHFRSGSSDGLIENSFIHDTGTKKPQYGEGVYVGSAKSNWGQYGGPDGADRSDHVTIRGNVITDTPAEGVDVKEGTTGGQILANTFTHDGYSGQNSADSWVDVKGNGWLIADNRGSSTLLDAFQTHVVATGWGTGNTFTRNTVDGGVPGYEVGVYPRPGSNGNTVRCDNDAHGALLGLATIPCTP